MTYELTTIAIACPTCGRSLVAEQPWDPGRVTTHLRVPEHADVREALLEQPRCEGSHVSLHLQPDGLGAHILPVEEVRVLLMDLARCGILAAQDGRPLPLGRRLHLLAIGLVLERETTARLRDSLSVADQLAGVPRG